MAPPGPTPPFPILVAGLPGVPGFNAFFNLRARYPGRVFGLAPPGVRSLESPDLPFGAGLLAADPEDPEDLERIFREHGFGAVLDASGWCALKPCERDPALARRLNVGIGVRLMAAARRFGARLVRLSTDLVFDGRPRREGGVLRLGAYREDSPISPVTVYGRLMAEAEADILAGYPDAAVLRIALPMGPSLNGHAGAVDWIADRFRHGRPATLYFDEVRSALYVQDLNAALAHFLAIDAAGIYHLGGPRPLSLYRMAQAVNRLGGYPPDLLMGCPRAAAGPMPPRAGDVSMDSSRAEAILPPGTLGPWPRCERHAPGGPGWHAEREAEEEAGEEILRRELYGYGWPGAWEHPMALVPEGFRVAGSPKTRRA